MIGVSRERGRDQSQVDMAPADGFCCFSFLSRQGDVPPTGSPQDGEALKRSPRGGRRQFFCCRIKYCRVCQQLCTRSFPGLSPALLPSFLGPALFWIHLVACLVGIGMSQHSVGPTRPTRKLWYGMFGLGYGLPPSLTSSWAG